MQALLVEQLLEAARQPDITGNRFVQAVAGGSCPLSNLQLYAAEIVPLTRSFPAVLVQIFWPRCAPCCRPRRCAGALPRCAS